MSDKRLGRGLEALLGPVSREQAEASGGLKELAVSSIRPNPFQPRTRLDEPALAELTASIEASGLLQPVVVRPRNGTYELIAGERRWRAVQRLGWRTVPAVVKDADDQTLLTLALIENLQRHDLSAIDEALGYQRLMDEFKMPQAEVARMVGRSRPAIANLLRLLRLPADVRALVHEGKLSEGHGRALLTAMTPRPPAGSRVKQWSRASRCATWSPGSGATCRQRRRSRAGSGFGSRMSPTPRRRMRGASRMRSESGWGPTCG